LRAAHLLCREHLPSDRAISRTTNCWPTFLASLGKIKACQHIGGRAGAKPAIFARPREGILLCEIGKYHREPQQGPPTSQPPATSIRLFRCAARLAFFLRVPIVMRTKGSTAPARAVGPQFPSAEETKAVAYRALLSKVSDQPSSRREEELALCPPRSRTSYRHGLHASANRKLFFIGKSPMLLPLVNRACSAPRIPTASLCLKPQWDPNAPVIRGREPARLGSPVRSLARTCELALTPFSMTLQPAPRKRMSMLSCRIRLAITPPAGLSNFGRNEVGPVLKASHGFECSVGTHSMAGMTFKTPRLAAL